MIANLERHAIRHIGIVSVSMEYIFSKCIHIYIYIGFILLNQIWFQKWLGNCSAHKIS